MCRVGVSTSRDSVATKVVWEFWHLSWPFTFPILCFEECPIVQAPIEHEATSGTYTITTLHLTKNKIPSIMHTRRATFCCWWLTRVSWYYKHVYRRVVYRSCRCRTTTPGGRTPSRTAPPLCIVRNTGITWQTPSWSARWRNRPRNAAVNLVGRQSETGAGN